MGCKNSTPIKKTVRKPVLKNFHKKSQETDTFKDSNSIFNQSGIVKNSLKINSCGPEIQLLIEDGQLSTGDLGDSSRLVKATLNGLEKEGNSEFYATKNQKTSDVPSERNLKLIHGRKTFVKKF